MSVCLYVSVCVYVCVCMCDYVYVCVSVSVLCSLTTEGKKLLMQYGSSLISGIKFRDNFVMIGQRGLAQGSAIEQVPAAHLPDLLLNIHQES